MTDQFGYKFVTRDYRSPNVPEATEHWTVGSHHKLPWGTRVDPGRHGFHYCLTLDALKRWLPYKDPVRLLRVRIPHGAETIPAYGDYDGTWASNELVVEEELSALWHLTGRVPPFTEGYDDLMLAGMKMDGSGITCGRVVTAAALVAMVATIVWGHK